VRLWFCSHGNQLVIILMSSRPTYCGLANLRDDLVKQVVCCTASADSATVDEIKTCLRMENPEIISMPVRRPDLFLFVVRKHPRQAQTDLVRLVRSRNSERVLVFCRKRDETEEVAQLFQRNGLTAVPYHSGIPDRAATIASFESGMNTGMNQVLPKSCF
jgi:ATP-dependent DNA helicase RecQ